MTGAAPRGRGRLSSIDILPVAAEEDVVWAFGELRARKKTQEEILESFNLRLTLKGLKPISKSAFNRSAIRTARMAHRLGEVREIARTLSSKFEDGGDEDLTLLLSETIKTLVFEMLENAGKLRADGPTAEMMANYAMALKSAEQTKKIAADTRKISEANFQKRADAAIESVKGLTPELKESFRRDLLGLTHGK
jgi:hypothetical protein